MIEILYLYVLQDEMKEILEKEKKEIWDEMQASLQVNNTRLLKARLNFMIYVNLIIVTSETFLEDVIFVISYLFVTQ